MQLLVSLTSYLIGGAFFVGINVALLLYFNFKRNQRHLKGSVIKIKTWQKAYLALIIGLLSWIATQRTGIKFNFTNEDNEPKHFLIHEKLNRGRQESTHDKV
ncbi:MAG: hypothetical protein HRT45_00345 [Bdellovibrionales bacterium]|nr:hypothetical protein [Bdellovibrionales bacterium]